MEYDSPTESTIGSNSDNESYIDTDKENELLMQSFCHIGYSMYFDDKIESIYQNHGGITFWYKLKDEIINKYYQYKFKRFSHKLLIKNNITELIKFKKQQMFSKFINKLIIKKRIQTLKSLQKHQNQLILKNFINKLVLKMKIEKMKKIRQLHLIELNQKKIIDTISEVSNRETTGSNISDRQFDFDPYSFLKTPTKKEKKDPYFWETGKTKYPKKLPKPPIPKLKDKAEINDNIQTTKQTSYVPYFAMGVGVLAMVFAKMRNN